MATCSRYEDRPLQEGTKVSGEQANKDAGPVVHFSNSVKSALSRGLNSNVSQAGRNGNRSCKQVRGQWWARSSSAAQSGWASGNSDHAGHRCWKVSCTVPTTAWSFWKHEPTLWQSGVLMGCEARRLPVRAGSAPRAGRAPPTQKGIFRHRALYLCWPLDSGEGPCGTRS